MTAGTVPDSTTSREKWLAAAAAVLRRSGRMTEADPNELVWEKLTRRTIEGLSVPPLGIDDHTAELGLPGQPPFLRGTGVAGGWDIRALLADPDPLVAATAAGADLQGGATSLWIRVGAGGTDLADLPAVLDEVYLDLAPVVLSGSEELLAANAFAAVLGSRTLHPDSNLGADPIGRAARSGEPADLGELPDIAALATTLGCRGFAVDGLIAHHRGAGEAQELGWLLGAGAAYLRALDAAGVPVEKALPLLEFRLAATDDQFLTIAKFRAARVLWDRVAELSGAGPDRPGQAQHAVTSWPMMTGYDSWTNLIRTTIAAFAAGVGGAQAITVLPFDAALGVPDPLGRRLARNISHLLLSESHVTAAADPAGGAPAIEALTSELAEAGWAEFGRIEAGGGVVSALFDGSVVTRWRETGTRREQQIAHRRRPITGISEFPWLNESLPPRRPSGTQLPPRWSTPFESLRDQPSDEVFLATLGPVAAHHTRATFAANALAAGGISTVNPGPTASNAEVLAAHLAAGSPRVVCLVGTDPSYAEQGPDLVDALRSAGARHVMVAGRPVEQLADRVDDHIALGDDLVQFLLRTQSALAQEPPR